MIWLSANAYKLTHAGARHYSCALDHPVISCFQLTNGQFPCSLFQYPHSNNTINSLDVSAAHDGLQDKSVVFHWQIVAHQCVLPRLLHHLFFVAIFVLRFAGGGNEINPHCAG